MAGESSNASSIIFTPKQLKEIFGCVTKSQLIDMLTNAREKRYLAKGIDIAPLPLRALLADERETILGHSTKEQLISMLADVLYRKGIETQAQAQTHVPNPVLGLPLWVATCGPKQSVSVGSPVTWHTDSDLALRQKMVDSILLLLLKRRPALAQWQEGVSGFAKKSEQSLYQNATTKEEYLDQQTLESRLQDLAAIFNFQEDDDDPQTNTSADWPMTIANHCAPQLGAQTMSSCGSS